MTWEKMKETFYNCMDFCEVYGRLPYFYITGGDPILHPDFWKLLGLMKEHGIPFTILGNPFHLNDENCKKMKEYGCEKYQLSLDGMRETHDWFRKPGSFDTTLEKIGCIKRAGMRSVIMTTVSGTNIDEIPDLIDTVVAHGADVFAFARYCPTSEEKDVGIEPLRYRKLLEDCDRKFKEYEAAGCHTYFNKKDHLWTLYEYETGEFQIPKTAREGMIYGGCNCGNCHLTILPTGDLYACRRVQNSKVRTAGLVQGMPRRCKRTGWKLLCGGPAVLEGVKKMDAETCLKKLEYVGVLAFATVDGEGNPQVRNISAIHYEADGLYFFTARGKNFCKELLEDGRVQILGYTKYKEMIRLSAKARPVPEESQKKWIDTIFREQPYLANVYPGDTREIGIVFEIKDARIEYFHLGVHPIFRETYVIGNGTKKEKGYRITDRCIGCGICAASCPQSCIEPGNPYRIHQEHCLHCGNCMEHCPVSAVERI